MKNHFKTLFLTVLGCLQLYSLVKGQSTTIQLSGNNLFENQGQSLCIQCNSGSGATLINTQNGNVGIGLSNPARKLDILGNVQITSPAFVPGSTVSSLEINSGEWQGILLKTNHSTSYRYGLNIEGTNAYTKLFAGRFNDNGNSTETFRVYSNGSLFSNHSISIGTQNTFDGSKFYSLNVNGYARVKELKVYPSWADFVFHEDYELPSLSDLKRFIEANNHLPGVPSEKEVKENGIMVGETEAILLSKIEELTLHIIRLDEELQSLKKSNELLIETLGK